MTTKARLFIGSVLAAAGWVLTASLAGWRPADGMCFGVYLPVTLLLAAFKVRLPGVPGTISMSFLPLLVAIAQFAVAETVLMAGGAALVQCLWRPKHRPRLIQVLFSAGTLILSTAFAAVGAHEVLRRAGAESQIALMALGAFLFYATNTLLVSIVVCLAESRPLRSIWHQCHLWAFPYYLVGALLVDLTCVVGGQFSWKAPLLLIPFMMLAHVSFRLLVREYGDGQRSGAALQHAV